jgi:uncharacterized protein with HEPN domain
MNPETKKCLCDVLDSARAIQKFTDGMDFEAFQDNDQVQAAVERKFEIVGEALTRMSRIDADTLEKITDYRRIIGFRNVIAHGYDSVDHEIVWEAVRDYMPTLVREVQELLEN